MDTIKISRLPSPFTGWRITSKNAAEWQTIILSDDEMAYIMQVVSGKNPDGSGKEPDNLLLKEGE